MTLAHENTELTMAPASYGVFTRGDRRGDRWRNRSLRSVARPIAATIASCKHRVTDGPHWQLGAPTGTCLLCLSLYPNMQPESPPCELLYIGTQKAANKILLTVTSPNVDLFQISFTGRLNSKFTVKVISTYSTKPHLSHYTAL